LAAAHIVYEIENLLFTNFAKTYFSQDLQHKVLSKHKTFAALFSLFSGTQFGKHWLRVSEWHLFGQEKRMDCAHGSGGCDAVSQCWNIDGVSQSCT